MHMPKLLPIPLDIKNKHPFIRIWYWRTFVRQWELLEDWSYELPEKSVKIVIPKGFIFDGVTTHRWLHFFLSPTGVLFIPGLVHDFAYRYDYLWAEDASGEYYKFAPNSGRHYWDSIFRHIGLDVNAMVCLNAFARGVLFCFGWISWRKNRKKESSEILPNHQK